jgi:hypothetical protein
MGGVADQCVQRAKKDGLGFMQMLLEAHGVNTVEVVMA